MATNNISILKSSHKKIHNTSENRKKNPVNILIQINNNNNNNYNLKSSVNNSTSKNQIMNDRGKKKIKKSEGIFIFDFEYSRKYLNVRLTNNTELNDQELNTLNYESALELDKRTFFQYYYGLIKRKQLIFFTFVPNNYNLIVIKISLFIIIISSLITVDVSEFIKDKSRNKEKLMVSFLRMKQCILYMIQKEMLVFYLTFQRQYIQQLFQLLLMLF